MISDFFVFPSLQSANCSLPKKYAYYHLSIKKRANIPGRFGRALNFGKRARDFTLSIAGVKLCGLFESRGHKFRFILTFFGRKVPLKRVTLRDRHGFSHCGRQNGLVSQECRTRTVRFGAGPTGMFFFNKWIVSC